MEQMKDWHVSGQKVVCVRPYPTWLQRKQLIEIPRRGPVYTIDSVYICYMSGSVGFHLKEIASPFITYGSFYVHWGFEADAFEPVVPKTTSIEQFTSLLNPSPATIRELENA